MQLPRGTFHSIKKHVTVRSLLDEASALHFTGSILVSFRDGGASLVLESGKTVLAAYQEIQGKAALERMEGMGDKPVDAELTLLNESQMGLAKEFNKSCRTNLETGSVVVFGKKDRARDIPSIQETVVVPIERGVRPARDSSAPRAPRRTFSEGEVEHLLDGDLEALDRMDLAKMSGKFRINAESIARDLNLDHLGDS